MSWLDRLLGRANGTEQERDDDEATIEELRTAIKKVRRRTDRIVGEYEQAENLRRPKQ